MQQGSSSRLNMCHKSAVVVIGWLGVGTLLIVHEINRNFLRLLHSIARSECRGSEKLDSAVSEEGKCRDL